MPQYATNPSAMMELLSASVVSASATAQELTNYVDISGYDHILVIGVVSASTSLASPVFSFRSSAVVAGTSPTEMTDGAGNTITFTYSGTRSAGDTWAAEFRTRGLSKFASWVLDAASGSGTVQVQIWGIVPRDTTEMTAVTDTSGARTWVSTAASASTGA